MSSAADLSKWHARIARVGVLAIAIVAFAFVYDAGVTWASVVGWRPGLAQLYPWLIEGFLAFVTYSAWLIKARGGSLKYPATLFTFLMIVGGYVNLRVHTHVGKPKLAAWESGASATLPVLILAAAVHLLLKTFERVEAPAVAAPVKLLEVGAAAPNDFRRDLPPAPVTLESEPEAAEPERFTADELKALPAPQLRGQANIRRLAEEATDPRARDIWRSMAEGSDVSDKSTLF